MSELVPIPAQVARFRKRIPKEHQGSLDTRLAWLWEQRFGTVQMIHNNTKDLLDRTATSLILQAIFDRDLDSISQLFQRIEGGARVDSDLMEQESIRV